MRIARRSVLLAAVCAALPCLSQAAERQTALARPALKVVRPTQAVMVCVARAGLRLVAGGERGLIVYSDDNGRQWQQAEVPVSVTLTGMRFASKLEGWAVGNMGVVLRTRDAGATWQRVLDGRTAAELALKAAQTAYTSASAGAAAQRLQGPLEDAMRLVSEGADKPFTDIIIRSDGSLLVIGAYGLAFSSTDGGATWQTQMQKLPNPDGLSLYGHAARFDEQWLVGEQGLLLRAVGNNGVFAAAESPSTGSLFGALSLRDGTLLMYGLRGKVFHSAAPGEPWATVHTPVDASLFAGLQLDDGRVLLAGQAGQLLVSADSGRSFSGVGLKQRYPFSAMAVTPDGAVVLAGARGLMRVERADLQTASESPGAKRSAT
ncbi:photosystem II stability/assembly factor-like protein [Diaphorobacter sp. HDW4A]|uniref:WD40/YVTN/BNR-like repeat-containing protein n=1 Tax=Diaphorobacter sp. HDW4A TaxID=2714924 RepID=UPI00140CF2FC|nr:photosystem II stability/assembly factor-like protein [Diaphorobacter sp. HDW4A]QIL79277.1 photosystem II stability/assembly factor-like protein [Diaphorobacter sp. HDW4A]